MPPEPRAEPSLPIRVIAYVLQWAIVAGIMVVGNLLTNHGDLSVVTIVVLAAVAALIALILARIGEHRRARQRADS